MRVTLQHGFACLELDGACHRIKIYPDQREWFAKLAGRPTPRQIQVGHLVAAGYDNREIAAKLGISMRTVKQHTGDLARRLNIRGGASTRVRLAVKLYKDKLWREESSG